MKSGEIVDFYSNVITGIGFSEMSAKTNTIKNFKL